MWLVENEKLLILLDAHWWALQFYVHTNTIQTHIRITQLYWLFCTPRDVWSQLPGMDLGYEQNEKWNILSPQIKKSSRNAQGTHLSTCFFRTRVTRTRFNNSFSRSIFWRKFRFPNQIMALLKTFLYAGAVFVSIREWGTRNLRIYQPKSWIIGHFIEFWAQIRTKNFSIFIIDVVIIRIYGTRRVLGCDKNALKQLHRYESTFRIWKKMCLLPKRDNGKKKRKSTIKQTRNLDQI